MIRTAAFKPFHPRRNSSLNYTNNMHDNRRVSIGRRAITSISSRLRLAGCSSGNLNPLQNQVEPIYLLPPNNSSLPHAARRPTAEPAPNPRKTAADAEIPASGTEPSLVHDFARSGKTRK